MWRALAYSNKLNGLVKLDATRSGRTACRGGEGGGAFGQLDYDRLSRGVTNCKYSSFLGATAENEVNRGDILIFLKGPILGSDIQSMWKSSKSTLDEKPFGYLVGGVRDHHQHLLQGRLQATADAHQIRLILRQERAVARRTLGGLT